MNAARRPEVTRRVAAGLVWLALVLGGLALVHHTEVEQREALDHLFAARAATSTKFISAYADDVAAHNSVLASTVLGGRLSPAQFQRQMKANGMTAAVVTDSAGRALAVYPDRPDLLGTVLSDRYPHLQGALAGAPTVSDVVPSAALGLPVVAFATPYETSSGRRVFSLAYEVGRTPLQSYLHNEGLETASEAIYLVDSQGVIVSSGGPAAVAARSLDDVDPALAAALATPGVRTNDVNGVPVQLVVEPVDHTPWRIVVTTPITTLYASVTPADVWVPRIGLGALAVALLGVMVLLERVNVQRSQIVEQQRAVASAADRARDEAVAASTAKSAFLATMSHELRTPMNAVIGMTDLLLGTRLDDQQRDFAETVHSSGQTLMLIINDVLDFSKIEAGQLQLERRPFPLSTTIEDCLDFVAAAAGAKSLNLYYEIDPGCPAVVVGDQTRVRQVVLNLLANAVKFTARGEVLVSVTTTPVAEDRHRISISVQDTGIGIPSERLDRLFQSFSQVDDSITRQYGGSGLGLAISRGLATAMGGELTVASTVGVGSTFRFAVVLTATSVGAASPPPDGLRGRRILVVDGVTTGRRVVVDQLQHRGAVCTAVATAEAARTLLHQGAELDAVVLDAHLVDGGGLDLGLELRRVAGRELPLVLLTRLGGGAAGTRGLPAVTSVPRPVKQQALVSALVEVLESRVPADPALVPVPEPAPPTRPMRVLLAEDNPVNQRVAQLMLGKLGHVVDTVDNGEDAVAATRAGGYDLVLMDVQMPVLDGLAATQRIRAELAGADQPHILALTASASVHDQNVCLAAGMDGHLAKPLRQADLRQTLEEVAALRGRTELDLVDHRSAAAWRP